MEWNFQVGAAYGRGEMGNVVSIWEGGISNYLKKGKRRLRAPRGPLSKGAGSWNHGRSSRSIRLRRGGVYRVTVMYYGRDAGPMGDLFGRGGVCGFAYVTCRL